MSVSGLEGETTWATVEVLAARHGVKVGRLREIRSEVEASVARWPGYAEQAHVPEAGSSELGHAFETRRQVLGRGRCGGQ